ncbi:adenylate/guanylate cyclase domain-containing protein [Spirulina sp. 06S082]|uniref:adenylate/guanylate cyclase domain-containing protein n=1 Tax=Spirulina sp. 06S082 TaxID=3110248 RepID=UPI002B2216F1|nr:adenylate/guanylate cyclase domain-containing protein [Spirulina sp. 06S082]MEA5467935.1 adenylate/guanylate cyclase domain-containing protein [Spirulina sp. 06S082]
MKIERLSSIIQWARGKSFSSRPPNSLSKQIVRRVFFLSSIGILSLATAMTLGLATSVERVKRKLERVNIQAARTTDLFILNIQSDLIATSASLSATHDPDAVLRNMLARNASLLDIFLVKPNGEIIVQQSRVGRPKYSQTQFNALKLLEDRNQNLDFGEVKMGEIYFANQFPQLDMAIAVTDDIGLPTATLWVSVDLNRLWNKIIDIKAGKDGYAFLVTEKGQIIAFRNRQLQDPEILLQDRIGRSGLDIARSGFNFYRGLGGEWVVAIAQRLEIIPSWFVVVEQPAREFLTPLLLVAAIWLGILLVAIAIVYGIINFTRKRIVIPLGLLREAVGRLSSGDWEYRFEIPNTDELGELATSFQRMAGQLRDTFATLEHNNAKMQVLNDALSQSERKLTQFLEAVPVGLFVVDAQGKPYYANQKAKELLGKGVDSEASAENLVEVYQAYIAGTDRLYPNENQPILRALGGEVSNTEDMEIHARDRRIPIEIWGTPIYNLEGEVSYAIAVFQDITERKKAEAERQRFTEQLRELNIAYERFVPEQFLQLLDKTSIIDVHLGDAVQKEMSVLFADIRNFTTLSERMTPEDNFKFINAYLSRMEPAIVENGGFIDKYVGDGIMALFSGSADDAIKGGISMLRKLKKYNKTRTRPDRPPIHIGIGINTGSLMLGTVGGSQRMDSTVISDTVNLASRLETLTKHYNVALLITHQMFLKLANTQHYDIRLIDRVLVKGKSEQISIFEVFDADPDDLRAAKKAMKTNFERAVLLYHLGLFAEASELFQHCLQIHTDDGAAQFYLEQCQNKII